MPYLYGIDTTYIIFVLPALLISLWAQLNVSGTFRRYTQIRSRRGITGAMAARSILNDNGLGSVSLERISGSMTDHYDPKTEVIRLSDTVRDVDSIAAIGVAAHEAGHAIQQSTGYFPMKVRSAIIPAAQFGSRLSMPLVLLGLIAGLPILADIGILLFGLVVVFQLVTLPVEFNASRRALKAIEDRGLLMEDELKGAKKVLRAAAMTYLAATFVALGNLLRLLALTRRRNNR